MHLISDVLATLGGRFNLILNPYDRCLYHNAYGDFHECRMDMSIGVKTPEGRLWALPFSQQAERLPFVEQFNTATSIAYRGVHPEMGIEMLVTFRAPFYPRNAGISAAPFYYVDIQVQRIDEFRWHKTSEPLTQAEIVFELEGEDVQFQRTDAGFQYSFTSHTNEPPGGDAREVRVTSWVEADGAESFGKSGLRVPFDLSTGQSARMSLLWSHWQDEPVLRIGDEATAFKYTNLFQSRDEMVGWAREERNRILRRCDYLDALVDEWSLGSSASNLSALALHSFLLNTWWTLRKDGTDWFSAMEGSCFYHSTIDVEYNDAMLYFALWPDLLGMLLDEWAEYANDGTAVLGQDGKGTAFLSHDMGKGASVGRQAYDHPMAVEENTNYLLLLNAWTAFTGDIQRAARKLPLCQKLAEFIVQADTTGNGVPDKGVANTIDDASPAVQYGREQTYLAVKAQAALWALAELEQRADFADSQAERWRAFASKSIKTMEDQAWLGDHYAVTLTRTTEGLVDPWSGHDLPPGELTGWDDYSIYTANGLLYLYLAGSKMPRWKTNRLAADVENATRETMGPYGSRHSSGADSIVWFSQNLWRDFVAAYLGVDMLNNVERYWDYQVTTGHNWRSSLYYDTTDGNNLNHYPRGTTVFGVPMAAAGMRLNRLDGELTLHPVRMTLNVPLLPLADWERMRVPWLKVYNREGVAAARISDRDLIEDLSVSVVGAELEPD